MEANQPYFFGLNTNYLARNKFILIAALGTRNNLQEDYFDACKYKYNGSPISPKF